MKKLLLILLILAALLAGVWIFLLVTTPKESARVALPLTPAQRSLVALVPAGAESFALIPTAAVLDAKLRANPITRDVVEEYQENQSLPRPWMIGKADLLAWKSGKETRYLLRLDPIRATLVRIYMMAGGDIGNTVLINAPADAPIAAAELQSILDAGRGLPPGDVLLVQRSAARGAYPPIGRPAVTTVSITPNEIDIRSAAKLDRPDTPAPAMDAKFAQNALLTLGFGAPPRALEDLNRLFGTKVTDLVAAGGRIVLYDIDTRKLLPRPQGVIAVPDDPERRQLFDSFVSRLSVGEALGVRPRTDTARGELLLSFDESIPLYIKDALQPAPVGRWSLRMDAPRMVPVLERLGDNVGFRVASPRLFRSARDLSHWIHYLQKASTIEAVDSVNGDSELLAVRVLSK